MHTWLLCLESHQASIDPTKNKSALSAKLPKVFSI
jgi:hypothetical protein